MGVERGSIGNPPEQAGENPDINPEFNIARRDKPSAGGP
jgi:hypothetical protein